MGKPTADLKVWERRMRLFEYSFAENGEKKIAKTKILNSKSSNFTHHIQENDSLRNTFRL